jgi:hypothetical protein
MSKKKKSPSSAKHAAKPGAAAAIASAASACATREGAAAAAGSCAGAMNNPFIFAAPGCAPSACAGCASKSPSCPPAQSFEAGPEAAREEELLPEPTAEERSEILALDHASVTRALRADEPAVVAVTTEFIVQYSLKVAQVLREGNEFFHVVTPTQETPAVERIAMNIVREAVSESLAMEASGWSA